MHRIRGPQPMVERVRICQATMTEDFVVAVSFERLTYSNSSQGLHFSSFF